MTTLKFSDTYNFLSKSAESEGFEQIVDFLNANPIRYALTINPTIYISFIEQLWSTIKSKTINGEVQLQALVDGKKIIITESTVRRDLQLEDAEGVDCLPNATIFDQLALMGYEQVSQKLTFYKAFFSQQWKFLIHMILQCLSAKTTAWNEFSSTMASAILCLATNQTFNFSKYIFESMVKNLENVSGKFLMYPRKPKRKDTQIPQSSGPTKHVAYEAVYKELDDSLVRAAITASSLEAEQDSSGGPRRQETMGDTIAQIRFENVSKLSNDPLLARGNTLQSGEDSLKLNELMELCTNSQTRVLDLEITKTTQANEIANEENLGEDASKQGRINAIDADEDITLVNDQDDADVFDVNTLSGEEVFVAEQSRNVVEEVVAVIDAANTIPVSAATITDVEVTLAQALAELKSEKPKVKANVVEEPSVPISAASIKVSAATTTTTATIPTPRKGIVITELGTSTTTTTISSQPSQEKVKDKGKGILVEEPVKPKKKDLIRLDEEIASKLQADFDEEERLAWEKDKALP
ncbi:hypothetical protein Tco_0761951 [Tanacetum coccineum]